jgi:ABC-type transport system substrate-binding protein
LAVLDADFETRTSPNVRCLPFPLTPSSLLDRRDRLAEMPTGSIWYDAEGLFAPKQDIAKAKELMKEAGYANSLSVEYLGLPQYPELLKTGKVRQDELK